MIAKTSKAADRSLDYADLLRRYLLPQRGRVAVLAGLLIAGIILQLANPQILRAFIDDALGGSQADRLLQLAGLFLVAAVLNQIVAIAETFVAENIGLIATNELRTDLTRHCLELDLSFHRARTPGELIERVDGDVANLSNFFARFVVQIIGNVLLLGAMLALLFAVHRWIGAAVSAFAVISLLVLFRLRDVGVPHWERARQASADLFGFLEERLAGTEDIRSSGAIDHTLFRLAEHSQALLRNERAASTIGSATASTGNLLLTLTTVVGLAVSAVLFQSGAITIGAVYLVFNYTQLLSRPIEQLTRQLQDLQKAAASLTRIRAIFAIRADLDRSGELRLPHGALSVELERISFGYVDDLVLRNVNLSVSPGEVVGLLGRTGGGKTSLARLLARFYDPTSGTVRVGGVDLREVATEDLRRAVGVVTQDVHLFHATVRDNLTLFDRRIPDDRIRAVLEDLGLWDWVQSLPSGLETRLAGSGSGLSAGEAQLLAFARVFLKDPGVIILDEASSRLDPATERRIETALDRLLAGRTVIVIAHRLSTIERADSIVILENGEIRESGRRIDLLRDPSTHFAHLLRMGIEEALA